MADLARRSDTSGSKPRVVFVRDGDRRVKRLEETDRLPLRLLIGVIVAIGVVGLVWMVGHVGFRRGFAPIVRVPELLGDPGGGLVTGTMILISIPTLVMRAGMAEPLWLMVGFVMIAMPAGALAAARPRQKGAPIDTFTFVMSSIGATLAGLTTIGILWWTGSQARLSRIGDLPFTADQVEVWQRNLETVAGLDVIAVVAAALWVVLSMRLAIPVWMRALVVSATMFALVVMVTAMSLTNAAAAHIQSPRSLCLVDDDESFAPRLLLGSTGTHIASVRVEGNVVAVELLEAPNMMTVVDRQSIVQLLRSHGAAKR
ncbi:MAG: hypothetical protein KDA25_03675 [Phycisphaerales bacterium]|nr:hypothetical protein [Phycisphaerales bacterium]